MLCAAAGVACLRVSCLVARGFAGERKMSWLIAMGAYISRPFLVIEYRFSAPTAHSSTDDETTTAPALFPLATRSSSSSFLVRQARVLRRSLALPSRGRIQLQAKSAFYH